MSATVESYFCTPNLVLYNQAKVAHLVEHDLAKVGVAGSSPVFRSISGCRIMVITPSFQVGDLGSIPGGFRIFLWSPLGSLFGDHCFSSCYLGHCATFDHEIVGHPSCILSLAVRSTAPHAE